MTVCPLLDCTPSTTKQTRAVDDAADRAEEAVREPVGDMERAQQLHPGFANRLRFANA